MGSIDFLFTDVLRIPGILTQILTGEGTGGGYPGALIRAILGERRARLITAIAGLDSASADAFGYSIFDLLSSGSGTDTGDVTGEAAASAP